jgi:uncharacterized small protein (DUF1192 family)
VDDLRERIAYLQVEIRSKRFNAATAQSKRERPPENLEDVLSKDTVI